MFKSIVSILSIALLFACFANSPAKADSKEYLDYSSQETLQRFRVEIPGADALLAKSSGVLVFPHVLQAGLGWGGQYGEGALVEKGASAPNAYYNILSVSVGFQLGIQSKSIMVFFLTDQALQDFKNSSGFQVGVNGSITVIAAGLHAGINTATLTSPIVAVILDPKGLMYNLTLEGTKISRIIR
jgi:lipid-binding SYLF domain-containing protein